MGVYLCVFRRKQVKIGNGIETTIALGRQQKKIKDE